MAGTAQPTDTPLSSKVSMICAAAVFVASLALYVLTLAPTVTLVDSGELIVAARTLGVAHPPGFPLYVLLAHLATLVPMGSVAVRVNFASALFAALASSLVALVVIEAMITPRVSNSAAPRSKRDRGKKGRKAGAFARVPGEGAEQHSGSLVVACLASGLLLAFSRTLWAYATIAEVYTLNALLILVVFLLLFRWRRGILEARRRRSEAATRPASIESARDSERVAPGSPLSPTRAVAPSPRDGFLYAAAFVFGLATGVHHVTVGLMLPALAVLVFATEGFGFFTSRRLLYAALFAFAGLSIYVYLPLAASKSPVMNWGDPRTLERLWWHVTGKQYQVNFSFSFNRIGEFVKLCFSEFGPWWLPFGIALAIVGFISLFKRDLALFWFLIIAIVCDLAYGLSYEIAEDKDAYYLPAFIAMTIAAGMGARWLVDGARSGRVSTHGGQLTMAVIVLAVPVVSLASNLPYNNRSHYFIAKDYVENIFKTVEPGGMLLTADWQVYSPMFYIQHIEGQRPDVISIDVKQLRRSWYYEYLDRAYPQMIGQARDEVDAFLEDLRNWEHDSELYNRDLMLNKRIGARFYEMILAFISKHLQSGPVYLTRDVATGVIGNALDPEDAELRTQLSKTYQLVPKGLVFQLFSKGEFQDSGDEPQLIMRGLADETIQFADDDVVKLKVLPAYVTMLYSRGRQLAAYGRHEQAIELFKRTLTLDPRFSLAQQGINESLNAMRKSGASVAR